MFNGLKDISDINWRKNKRNDDGTYQIIKDTRVYDYILFKGNKTFFGTDNPEGYGGWVTRIDTKILKVSPTHPKNKRHGYDERNFDGKNLHEIPMTIDQITEYSILFADK